MGKEATIGLAVILVLLITFGVVLVNRLSDTDDPEASSSAQRDQEASPESGNDPAVDKTNTRVPAARPSKLTVLAAKPTSGQTPELSTAAAGQFSPVPDREGSARSTDGGVSQASPPSMMPNPPAPSWANPYDQYGAASRQTAAPQVRQLHPVGMSTSTAASEPYDPFPTSQTAQRAADLPSVGQLRVPPNGRAQRGPMPGALRSLGPYRQTRPRSETGDFDYPADEYSARQTPAWRQNSQYMNPTQQQAQTPGGPPAGSNLYPPYAQESLRNAAGDYEVQPNESYWVISQRLYGSGAYFKALAEHNRRKVPREDRLAVGEVISAPDVSELEKAYPDLCPKPSRRDTLRNRQSLVGTRTSYVGGRIYVVEEGDTLFDIARYELGKASRWVEILRLNRDLVGHDADYISAGMRLVLPDNQPSERVTQRPGSIYRP